MFFHFKSIYTNIMSKSMLDRSNKCASKISVVFSFSTFIQNAIFGDFTDTLAPISKPAATTSARLTSFCYRKR